MKTSANSKKPRKDAAPAATPTRTPQDIPAADLRHAPWNPRAKITPESVADLTASIQKDGLIQRLVVVPDGKKYTVVAGNRRLVACRAAGLDPVPCDVMDVTPEAARRLTLLENLQRADVDPILESDLIEKLIADGMTQAEIAAETGRGARWVARRANLRNLSPVWRKRLADGMRITTDCLERIASYPADIQNQAADSSSRDDFYGLVGWSRFSSLFSQLSRDLNDAPFSRGDCTKCPNNSANAPLLFQDEDDGKPAKYGRCLNCKCFNKHVQDAVDAAVAKAEADGRTVVRCRFEYDTPSYWDLTLRPDDKHTVLYVYPTHTGMTVARWGEAEKQPVAPDDDYDKKLREEKLAKRERNKAIRELAAWCAKDGNLARFLSTDDRFANPYTGEIFPWVPLAVQSAFPGLDGWAFVGTEHSETAKAAAATLFGNLRVPPQWAKAAAAEIIKYLDPQRNEISAVENAKLILALVPETKEFITPEGKAAIASAEDLDKVRSPEIKWRPDEPEEE